MDKRPVALTAASDWFCRCRFNFLPSSSAAILLGVSWPAADAGRVRGGGRSRVALSDRLCRAEIAWAELRRARPNTPPQPPPTGIWRARFEQLKSLRFV